MTDKFAVPVRYMPIKTSDGYAILDTSFDGQGAVVCNIQEEYWAYYLAKVLNKAEGYEYP